MAATIAERLYGRFLSTVPLFSGLSTEVISALCLRCKPLLAMKNQTIIKQGQHGTEMYLLMSGEAEVSEQHGEKQVQLGFLSEGAFFGEAAVLRNPEDGNGGHGALRTRTVRAVTESELCYLLKDDVHALYIPYPELHARLARFVSSSRVLNDRTIAKLDLTRNQMQVRAPPPHAASWPPPAVS